MERVVVIGNSGGGKSVLARTLAQRRDLPYHEIDAASGVALTAVSTLTRRKP